MIPGPPNILGCPFCGGEKQVMSLVSGNTFGGTVWSDTRRHYPMLPEVSPIQRCPHCGKYFFIEQAKSVRPSGRDPDRVGGGSLGTLSYAELKEARRQMDSLSLTAMQRWVLNHELLMAYNDEFRRHPGEGAAVPTADDEALCALTIRELLDGIDRSADYELYHAELLREAGRFDEARTVVSRHDDDDDRWVVEAMLSHIAQRDSAPFLLLLNGEPVAVTGPDC